MGCCGSKGAGSLAPMAANGGSNLVTLVGDMFSPDTRTIYILIKLGGDDEIPYKLQPID